MSTPTPRTDAKLLTVAERTSPHYLPEMVYADFARTLERELAIEQERATHYRDHWQKERAKVQTLRDAVERIEDAARSVQDWGGTHLGEEIDNARALAATEGVS